MRFDDGIVDEKLDLFRRSLFFCIQERANVRLLRFAKPIMRKKNPTVLQSNEKQIKSNLSFPDISSNQAVRNWESSSHFCRRCFLSVVKFRLSKQLAFS